VALHQHRVEAARKFVTANLGELFAPISTVRRPRHRAQRLARTNALLGKNTPLQRPHDAKRRMRVNDATYIPANPVRREVQGQLAGWAQHAKRVLSGGRDADYVGCCKSPQRSSRGCYENAAVVKTNADVTAGPAHETPFPKARSVTDDFLACVAFGHGLATYDARWPVPSGEARRMLDRQGLGRVVIAEPFDERGVAVLTRAGVEVISCVGSAKEALHEALRDARGLIVRSETRVDGDLLARAPQLQVVARAGVGVDAIDVDAATAAGIVVVNTPGANTIAAAEHTFAMMLAAFRHIAQANASVRAARWNRQDYVGNELFGKTLGIVGLGRIGSSVASRATAFGMRVVVYDPFVPVSRGASLGLEMVELDALLAEADVVTLHVPLTPQTVGLIDMRALKRMRPNAVLVNCARGAIVDLEALLGALDDGRLRAAALDVVPDEPPPPDSLSARVATHPRVVATPHLSGSTHEAKERVALELADDVVRVLGGRPPSAGVNVPTLSAASPHGASAFIDLCFRMGAMLPQLFDRVVREEIGIVLQGDLAEIEAEPFVAALLAGCLRFVSDRRVTMVNAAAVAREIGVRTMIVREGPTGPFRASLAAAVEGHRIVGTVLPHGARIVEIDGFELDAVAEGAMLVTRHRDVPGMVGRIGTILGEANVNISTMQVARTQRGGSAMMVLELDRAAGRSALQAIGAVEGIESVRSIEL
jgi:D-3-phosphoglycerate dehydrogenase / 2-oxoglutarate reductase